MPRRVGRDHHMDDLELGELHRKMKNTNFIDAFESDVDDSYDEEEERYKRWPKNISPPRRRTPASFAQSLLYREAATVEGKSIIEQLAYFKDTSPS